jgi:large subunit ribosomal protein L13
VIGGGGQCRKVKVSGCKVNRSCIGVHSGYPGGFKEVRFSEMRERQPEEIVRRAVFGMLAPNRLRDDRMTRLKIIKGSKKPI